MLVNAPHNVTGVVAELHDTHACLDVPQHASHVATAGDDLAIVDETATAEVARVGTELPGAVDAASVPASEVVDAADVVEPTACDKASRGCVCTGHDPGAAEGDGMHFVRRVGIPDDQFSVLTCRNEVPAVLGPVHGVDLCKVTTQGTTGLHDDTWQWVDLCGHCAYCKRGSVSENDGQRLPRQRTARVGRGLFFSTDALFETLCLSAGSSDAFLDVAGVLRHVAGVDGRWLWKRVLGVGTVPSHHTNAQAELQIPGP